MGSPLAPFWRRSVLSRSAFRRPLWRHRWCHLSSRLPHILSTFLALIQSAVRPHRGCSERCLRAAVHCRLFLRDTLYWNLKIDVFCGQRSVLLVKLMWNVVFLCFGQLSNPRSNSAVGREICRVLSNKPCLQSVLLSIEWSIVQYLLLDCTGSDNPVFSLDHATKVTIQSSCWIALPKRQSSPFPGLL